MPGTRLVKDLLERTLSANFVGREGEMRLLLQTCGQDSPMVTWLHGLAGIGKSALLQEFAVRARELGASVVRLDARSVEPTPEAFLEEIGCLLNQRTLTVEAASQVLAAMDRTVIIVDSYELLGLLDAWVKLTFVPALPDGVRVVLSSRYSPGIGWLIPVEWQGLFRAVPLSALSDAHASQMLERASVPQQEAKPILRLTRGHPLAIRLAVAARAAKPTVEFDALAAQAIVHQLTQVYLADVSDWNTRIAIEAASVVRRTTRSLLAAMLAEDQSPGEQYDEQYDRLANSSFFEVSGEGLRMHEAVQESIAVSLRSSDPQRFDRYRRAAWQQIRSGMRAASKEVMWRYTADMLYLVQLPLIREAFFPSGSQQVVVEPAQPHDGGAILAIAQTHESPAGLQSTRGWWQKAPECFRIVRDASGDIIGFYLLLNVRKYGADLPPADPLASNWLRHLRANPIAKEETAILLRRWLSASAGEKPSSVQAACWLDVKRSYMQLRPHIRRCYISVADLTPYAAAASQLGFHVIGDASASFDGMVHHLAVLDFGPASIDGWLSSTVAKELGLEQTEILDADARELILSDGRQSLTSLEFAVLRYLSHRNGATVSRADLLQHVWGHTHDGGSNVVDVVVRSLRRKLGDRAWMIATVRGVGYRLLSD